MFKFEESKFCQNEPADFREKAWKLWKEKKNAVRCWLHGTCVSWKSPAGPGEERRAPVEVDIWPFIRGVTGPRLRSNLRGPTNHWSVTVPSGAWPQRTSVPLSSAHILGILSVAEITSGRNTHAHARTTNTESGTEHQKGLTLAFPLYSKPAELHHSSKKTSLQLIRRTAVILPINIDKIMILRTLK